MDNITEWTKQAPTETLRRTEECTRWMEEAIKEILGAPKVLGLGEREKVPACSVRLQDKLKFIKIYNLNTKPTLIGQLP